MFRRTAFLCCVAVALVLPSSASATHVQCGDVITQDTTLDSDLVDCPGDEVVIGANEVTLDLGGHLVHAADAPQGQYRASTTQPAMTASRSPTERFGNSSTACSSRVATTVS